MSQDGKSFHDRSPCTRLIIKSTMHIKLMHAHEFGNLGCDNFSGRMNFVRAKLERAGLDFKTEIKDWTKIRPGGRTSEELRYVRVHLTNQ